SLSRRVIGAVGKIGGSIAGVLVNVLGGVRGLIGQFTRLFFGIAIGALEFGIGGAGFRHDTPRSRSVFIAFSQAFFFRPIYARVTPKARGSERFSVQIAARSTVFDWQRLI